MLLKEEFVLRVLEPESFQSRWQVQYLGQHYSKKLFRVWECQRIEVYPAAIIKLKSHTILILCLPIEYKLNSAIKIKYFEVSLIPNQIFETNLPEFELNLIQELFSKNYKFTNPCSKGAALKNIEGIEIKDYSCYSEGDYTGLEEVVEGIYKRIEAVALLESNYRQQKFSHQEIALEYYKLLTESDLANSDSDANRIQDILQLAEEDDILSLLLNEVDSLVIQTSSSNSEPEALNANCKKWAQVFQTHVDSCNQIDSEVFRLTTQISSLIEKLQDFKSSEVFDASPESPQAIDAKVESLELLRQAAEVEKDRRELRKCLKSD